MYSVLILSLSCIINKSKPIAKLSENETSKECIQFLNESVDRSSFSMKLHGENVLRSTLSYPNETSKKCIQFL